MWLCVCPCTVGPWWRRTQNHGVHSVDEVSGGVWPKHPPLLVRPWCWPGKIYNRYCRRPLHWIWQIGLWKELANIQCNDVCGKKWSDRCHVWEWPEDFSCIEWTSLLVLNGPHPLYWTDHTLALNRPCSCFEWISPFALNRPHPSLYITTPLALNGPHPLLWMDHTPCFELTTI